LFVHSYTGENPIGLEIYNLANNKPLYVGNWDNKRIEFIDENAVVVYDLYGEITKPSDPYEEGGYSVTMQKFILNLESGSKTDMSETITINFQN
jgi:hypothetical protein